MLLVLGAPAPAAPPGWSFAPDGRAVYDGRPLAVGGRKLDVLRALVGAAGPVGVDGLRAAWGGTDVDDSAVRFQVAELRKALRAEFPDWEGEVVQASAHGYRLLLT